MGTIALAEKKTVALDAADDIALADRLCAEAARIRQEIRHRIIGQEQIVDQALIALFGGGNCLIIGVPGLAKTLLVNTISRVLDLRFSRIQFTPDLMPSDITGTDIIQDDPATGQRRMVFTQGPIFANIVLADEINRTPPKTQAALLEAMQEQRVTVQGTTYDLPKPFAVFATQNPIELEGTYPLPEAQLDRFMFQIKIDYLTEDEEIEVVQTTTAVQKTKFTPILTAEDIVAFQQLVRRVPVSDSVAQYAVALVRSSRPGRTGAPDFIEKWVSYGASTRAAQYLILGGKARALLHGRYHVSFEDIRAVAYPVLRHRLLLNFHAQSERLTTENIIDRLLEHVPLPKSGM